MSFKNGTGALIITPAGIAGTAELQFEVGLLSVDGTIVLENLSDVVFVERPVFGQPNTTITLFKIDPDSKGASRVPVKLGRGSVTTIEVLEGLKVGDRVILSDMSAWDGRDRLRLN